MLELEAQPQLAFVPPAARADKQLDIEQVIPSRRAHIGVSISRKEWLLRLEPLTRAHREKWAAHFAFGADRSLLPQDEKIEGVDTARYKRMRKLVRESDASQSAKLTSLTMIDALELKDDLRATGDLSRDEKLDELAAEIEVTIDERRNRPRVEGDQKHPRGSVSGYKWYKQRQKGQLERFDRVFQCGALDMIHWCGACAKNGPVVKLTCDQHRLCMHCKRRRVDKFQRRFRGAQKTTMQGLWNDGLLAPTRIRDGKPVRGGQWNQHFMTFTLPHSGDIAQDVRELPRAWIRYLRLYRDHLEKDVLGGEVVAQRAAIHRLLKRFELDCIENGEERLAIIEEILTYAGDYEDKQQQRALLDEYESSLRHCTTHNQARLLLNSIHMRMLTTCSAQRTLKRLMKKLVYVRVIEVTEGLSGEGHAHLHVWNVGPYVDVSRLAHLWGQALSPAYQNHLRTLSEKQQPKQLTTDCDCGKDHDSAVGVQTVDRAIEMLCCRLKKNGVPQRGIDAIMANEIGWYRTRRGPKGRPLTHLWRPLVHVRKCDDDVAAELCKYLIKDGDLIEGEVEYMQPEIFAKIYAALEGRRMIVATLGLLKPPDTRGCFCLDCGSVYRKKIETVHFRSERGPPDQQALAL